ncbi:unnamed protein product, partial [Iphiclides podalirius]
MHVEFILRRLYFDLFIILSLYCFPTIKISAGYKTSACKSLCPLVWECRVGCRCSAGYIRDEYSKNCVLVHQCPG